jgi:hypothetical protein
LWGWAARKDEAPVSCFGNRLSEGKEDDEDEEAVEDEEADVG